MHPPSSRVVLEWLIYHAARVPPPLNYRVGWCAVHAEPDHLHRAVCSGCLAPLSPAMQPTCWHPAAPELWRCWEGQS